MSSARDLCGGLIMLVFLPINGFLGTGATFAADLNLFVQLAMGLALLAGAFLARRKCYTAHGVCQTMVLLLNLVMIGLVMWPSFQQQVRPGLRKVWHRWYYAMATAHALLGVAAEVLGIYIVLVAGLKVLPTWLGFRDWKRWMRMELLLWWLVLLAGMATYYAWYVAPFQ
jgi:uncharacterized membrane protein YozB (DUF420 family)